MNNGKWHLLFAPAVEYINILKPLETLHNKTNEISALMGTGKKRLNRVTMHIYLFYFQALIAELYNLYRLFINLFRSLLFSIFKGKTLNF